MREMVLVVVFVLALICGDVFAQADQTIEEVVNCCGVSLTSNATNFGDSIAFNQEQLGNLSRPEFFIVGSPSEQKAYVYDAILSPVVTISNSSVTNFGSFVELHNDYIFVSGSNYPADNLMSYVNNYYNRSEWNFIRSNLMSGCSATAKISLGYDPIGNNWLWTLAACGGYARAANALPGYYSETAITPMGPTICDVKLTSEGGVASTLGQGVGLLLNVFATNTTSLKLGRTYDVSADAGCAPIASFDNLLAIGGMNFSIARIAYNSCTIIRTFPKCATKVAISGSMAASWCSATNTITTYYYYGLARQMQRRKTPANYYGTGWVKWYEAYAENVITLAVSSPPPDQSGTVRRWSYSKFEDRQAGEDNILAVTQQVPGGRSIHYIDNYAPPSSANSQTTSALVDASSSIATSTGAPTVVTTTSSAGTSSRTSSSTTYSTSTSSSTTLTGSNTTSSSSFTTGTTITSQSTNSNNTTGPTGSNTTLTSSSTSSSSPSSTASTASSTSTSATSAVVCRYNCTCSSDLTKVAGPDTSCSYGNWTIKGSVTLLTGTVITSSTDTITVEGNYEQGQDAILEVWISSGTVRPGEAILVVNGSVTLSGGLIINSDKELASQNLTIIEVSPTAPPGSSIQGQFSSVEVVSPQRKCRPIKSQPKYEATSVSVLLSTTNKCSSASKSRKVGLGVGITLGFVFIIVLVAIMFAIIYLKRLKRRTPKIRMKMAPTERRSVFAGSSGSDSIM